MVKKPLRKFDINLLKIHIRVDLFMALVMVHLTYY
ncbi:UNVERIFIED_CONTAM: hypothetical protein ABID98_002901 [Brevibacillus sp. OAP136]